MTVHVLKLHGDRRSGRTTQAIDTLEYRMLQGFKVAYAVPTQRHANFVKKAFMPDFPVVPFEQLLRTKLDATHIVLDNCERYEGLQSYVQALKARLSKHEFAQIMVID